MPFKYEVNQSRYVKAKIIKSNSDDGEIGKVLSAENTRSEVWLRIVGVAE